MVKINLNKTEKSAIKAKFEQALKEKKILEDEKNEFDSLSK